MYLTVQVLGGIDGLKRGRPGFEAGAARSLEFAKRNASDASELVLDVFDGNGIERGAGFGA